MKHTRCYLVLIASRYEPACDIDLASHRDRDGSSVSSPPNALLILKFNGEISTRLCQFLARFAFQGTAEHHTRRGHTPALQPPCSPAARIARCSAFVPPWNIPARLQRQLGLRFINQDYNSAQCAAGLCAVCWRIQSSHHVVVLQLSFRRLKPRMCRAKHASAIGKLPNILKTLAKNRHTNPCEFWTPDLHPCCRAAQAAPHPYHTGTAQ